MNPTLASPDRPRDFFPVLLLFIGSGCSALIYEVVWLQLLQLVIGSSAVSLGVLLGTFMGGMGLGGLLLPRVVSARWHPLWVYAVLELGIGLCGVAVLFGVPIADQVYASVADVGAADVFFRGLVCAACLLLPALLMGATLPAAARWVETTPAGVSWLGLFYGGNIVGAVAGCLLAGFYLLRVHDMETATYAAVAINLFVGLVALALAKLVPYQSVEEAEAVPEPEDTPLRWPVYLAIGLSGFGALGAEVVWTRLLALMLGATVYTFSIVLAVFLAGLGLGSTIGASVAGRTDRPAKSLAICQIFLAVAVIWAANQLAVTIPFWPFDPRLSPSPWNSFQLDVMRCLWAVLPAACLWGASFPLALAAVATPGRDAGKVIGGVYAANTVGGIAGAVGFSVFIVAWTGTQAAQIGLVGVAGAAAATALLAGSRAAGWKTGAVVVAVGVVAAVMVGRLVVPETPWELIAWGRELPLHRGQVEPLFVGEGVNSSVAVTRMADGTRIFSVSGRAEASSAAPDMRVERMLGHIPAMIHPSPKTVLVVGCGAGVTAGSFLNYPSVERIVICELEPLVPTRVAPNFAPENNDVVNDPRVTIIYDDARHFIRTTRETFDVVTSDPIHPWIKGSATLYTQEYFELVKKRLNPGGVATQWVPLYQSTPEVVKSEVATFFTVFPDGVVWGNDVGGKGYDVVTTGLAEPGRIDVDALAARMARPDHAAAARSLAGVGFASPLDVLATYTTHGPDLAPWLADAQINRDRNLRLQYLAGMGLNVAGEWPIFDAMRAYRRYPDDLFVIPDAGKKAFQVRTGFAPKE